MINTWKELATESPQRSVLTISNQIT